MKLLLAKLSTTVAMLVVVIHAAPAADKEQTALRRAQLLVEMTNLAQKTKVAGEDGADMTLVEKPVFRYDDQPRRFIDATMWIWTEDGRPAACQKIEARYEFNTGQPLWGYCFTSLSPGKLSASWGERSYKSSQPGIAWLPLEGSPAPAAGNVQRKRQLRELARGFTGRALLNPRTSESAELRLFTTPIYEYSDPDNGLLAGGIFGFETNGTNPDVLVLIEARESAGKFQWQFAPARMTTGGITLNYGERKVWECEFVQPSQGPFANWLFFPTPRNPVPAEVAP
jgi:hypothetical protein